MKFVLLVDHKANYFRKFSYFKLESETIEQAKNEALINFHKIDSVYVIQILQYVGKTKDGENKYKNICEFNYNMKKWKICEIKNEFHIYENNLMSFFK